MRGDRGGIGIHLTVLFVLLISFVAYQSWFKKHNISASASQEPTAQTAQVATAVEESMTAIAEAPAVFVPVEEVRTPPAIAAIQPGPSKSSPKVLVQHPSTLSPSMPHKTIAVRRSDAFADITRRVPLLLISQMAPNTLGMYSANPGALFLADIAVSHDPTGKGEISTDGPYGQSILSSLNTAVQAASHAVGYDIQFLRVRLIGRAMRGVTVRIEGPSAGAIMAVAVASALLGDTIRPDICMSGTIGRDLRVGRVGGLADKIAGCRQGNYRELIVPFGQTSMDLALKGMSTEIKITEVNSFAEAYEAAIGQALRRM